MDAVLRLWAADRRSRPVLIVLPTADPDHWRYYPSDADVVAYLSDEFRAAGAMEVALGALTMLIAVRWFKAGDPWAWLGFWVFPALFAWQMVTTCGASMARVVTRCRGHIGGYLQTVLPADQNPVDSSQHPPSAVHDYLPHSAACRRRADTRTG